MYEVSQHVSKCIRFSYLLELYGLSACDTLRFIINGEVKINGRGGFKDFEKLINGGGLSGGLGQNMKEKRRKYDYPY